MLSIASLNIAKVCIDYTFLHLQNFFCNTYSPLRFILWALFDVGAGLAQWFL